jgi:hypothetical protein
MVQCGSKVGTSGENASLSVLPKSVVKIAALKTVSVVLNKMPQMPGKCLSLEIFRNVASYNLKSANVCIGFSISCANCCMPN